MSQIIRLQKYLNFQLLTDLPFSPSEMCILAHYQLKRASSTRVARGGTFVEILKNPFFVLLSFKLWYQSSIEATLVAADVFVHFNWREVP